MEEGNLFNCIKHMLMMDTPAFERWFNQAVHTYDSAKRDYNETDFDWACFKCQQAAVFALKAFLKRAGNVSIGHSLLELTKEIEALGINVDEIKCSLALEKFYIPTRYPDAYAEGSPFEFYDAEKAKKALDYCLTILEFVRERHYEEIIQLRNKKRKNLLKKAETYLEKLRKIVGPITGVVFGSVSRGDFNDACDIDILVIAEELPAHPVRRLEVLLSPWVPGIDPKGYTRSEFEQLKQKKNPFIQLILEEGIVLVDEIGVLKEL